MLIFADENIKSFTMEEQKTTDLTTEELSKAQRTIAVVLAEIVDLIELINFPTARFKMELYYDKECFIYTNGISKFIVHPNYEIKISRGKVKVVNFITATKIKDPAEFTLPKYIKI